MNINVDIRLTVTQGTVRHHFYEGDAVYIRKHKEATTSGPYTLIAIEKQGITLSLPNGKKEIDIAFTELEELARATYTDNAEHCVTCGQTIPEGRQLCPTCERGVAVEHE